MKGIEGRDRASVQNCTVGWFNKNAGHKARATLRCPVPLAQRRQPCGCQTCWRVPHLAVGDHSGGSGRRHVGQSCLYDSHRSRQALWKTWLQGVTARCSLLDTSTSCSHRDGRSEQAALPFWLSKPRHKHMNTFGIRSRDDV